MSRSARCIDSFLREHETFGAGYYRELAPSPDLREIVACNWVSVVRQGKLGARTPIIPDGCSDIMTYDAEAPFVVGPDTKVRWARLREGTVITGLRLRPGAVRAVFGCSATVLLDSDAKLSELGAVPQRFLDRLDYAADLRARHAVLEDWVRTSIAGLSAHDRAVLSACRQLAGDAALEIGVLARRLGWHARTVHRQFVAACGYGPKHLQRIMRVQLALRAVHLSGSSSRLSQVAAVAGFADQAHMTREFRDLTGFTPQRYLSTFPTSEVGSWLSDSFNTAPNPLR